MVALHGGFGSGEQFRSASGLDRVAEDAGAIVVYPDGIGGILRREQLRSWNAGRCCGPAQDEGVDDVGFLRSVIDEVSADHAVDRTRVLVIGHSNGGMMAFRMACEAADVVTGVGAVGSSLETETCDPSRPVSAALVHGLDDRNHPYGGGAGEGFANADFQPARDAVESLAAVANCELPAVDRTEGDLTVTDWTGCDQGAAVRLTTIAGAGHAWPGGDDDRSARRLAGPPYEGFDASRELVGFLLAHPRSAGG